MSEVFKKLITIDVNSHVKAKQRQRYLPWTYAWSELKKLYPDASYEFVEQENGLPYFDSDIGVMVKTKVTVNGETLSMHLPVMNSVNKAMKLQQYSYKTKAGEKLVEAVTMFDINTALMRCLTKNIAMFGLGLYIYNDEQMPEVETIDSEQMNALIKQCKKYNMELVQFNQAYQIRKLTELQAVNFDYAMDWIAKSNVS